MGLTDEAEVGRLELAGAQPPKIDRELAGHGDDGFLSGRTGGKRSFGQDLSPFHDRFVGGLEADQAPGGLDQGGAQPRVAVSARGRTRPTASLVRQLCTRVFPLLYSPGQRPV